MRHRRKLYHECSRPKIVDPGILGLRACGQHGFFKLGYGKLPIRLTKRDQSNAGGHQIGDITLPEGWQGDVTPNSLPR